MEKTHIHRVRLTETQYKTLLKLKEYDVNLSQFIRQAIKEKIAKDWKQIKECKTKIKCPF